MFDIDAWLGLWRRAVEREFGLNRIKFMGVQGSYARGEAHEGSDIDVVLILDEFTPSDAARYRACVAGLPERNLLCGFVSGELELKNWPKEELFSFCLDTLPLSGSLYGYAALVSERCVCAAALNTVSAIYHACVHNMLHERSDEVLKELYKSAFFAVRAIHCVETGERVRTRAGLLNRRGERERDLIESRPQGDFDTASARLMTWSSGQLCALG